MGVAACPRYHILSLGGVHGRPTPQYNNEDSQQCCHRLIEVMDEVVSAILKVIHR